MAIENSQLKPLSAGLFLAAGYIIILLKRRQKLQ
jgi:hypothetical protein